MCIFLSEKGECGDGQAATTVLGQSSATLGQRRDSHVHDSGIVEEWNVCVSPICGVGIQKSRRRGRSAYDLTSSITVALSKSL